MTPPPPVPGGAVGILGGGQLGRMLAVAAARLGHASHVYAPEPHPPAAAVASRHHRGEWDDEEAFQRFLDHVDRLTYEFENIPLPLVESAERQVFVFPPPRALGILQDRLSEKRFIAACGLETAPYAPLSPDDDESKLIADFGLPLLVKTRRFGYDGKGIVTVADETQLRELLKTVAPDSCIVEARIAFHREISVIAARDRRGRMRCYDPGVNRCENGILRETRIPAPLAPHRRRAVVAIAHRLLERLDYVGVMGVELFEIDDDRPFIVNELAPRVHNSGHWTEDACAVGQFEQHLRAGIGAPLGETERHSDCVMTNLLGEEALDIDDILKQPNACLHLYGKDIAAPRRKMGHVTRLHRRGRLP